ncbi:MAG: hypothetical protein JWL61_2751 [Gemmatimonadetes bacterium]|nr:hypothetical protein [Gemmatimonadota bacterium]
MHRFLLLVALVVVSVSASAQQVFIAPTSRTIVGSTDQSNGADQAHILVVANESTVPIIVFGVIINQCENVRQWCSGQRTRIAIPPGTRRNVGRVEPKNPERSFNYRWSFSYHADSSDLKAIAALREHGIGVDVEPEQRIVMRRPIDTSAPPGIEKPLSRERLTPEERGVRGTVEPRDTAPAPTFRFKVAYGSILGSTMMPGAPIQLTGPCINPAESARYEKDAKIARTPWRPPVFSASFSRLALPLELKDSVLKSKDVLIRFVADSTGDAIPESASVLESPHGAVSVSACKAAIAGRSTPARDKAGNAIRAWVQMPVSVGR